MLVTIAPGPERVNHQPPVLAHIESTVLRYTAGKPPVPVTPSITVGSAASATLAGATVKIKTINSGFTAGKDSLGFTNQNRISGSYKASSGVLTLAGTASVARYQAALRSVTYRDSDAEAPTMTRKITFQVDDGKPDHRLSNVASRTVLVTRAGPPVAVSGRATTGKNSAVDINVLANDTDPAGLPLTVASIDTTGTLGLVSVNGNGTIHYDPDGQFAGLITGQTATDTFTYKATDGFQTSSSTTVTVTIAGTNDAPVVSSIGTTPLSYQAGTPTVTVTSTLAVSDDDDTTMSGATVSITSGFDPEADLLEFTNQNGIASSYNAVTGMLTLTGSASTANYQAALRAVEFATSDSSASPAARTVSFTVTDSLGATSTAAARTIDVTGFGPSRPPTVVNHSYNAVGNTPLGVGTTPSEPAATVTGSVLNGDSDSDPAAALSVTANTTSGHGTVTMNPNGTFTYLPNPGYSGTDRFQCTIVGSNDPSATATATVTINVGTVVWYVNDSVAAAGNGEAASPFNTLAAVNTAAGANSIEFLYQGNAAYLDGVDLQPGEDLFGQPHGLTVDGYSLVPPGGSAPVITSGTGAFGIENDTAGIDLAEGADVEGVNVGETGNSGIWADGVNDATVGVTSPVAISGPDAHGIEIDGGDGDLNFGATSVTGSTAEMLVVFDRGGGTVTFGGHITDTGASADTDYDVFLFDNGGATIAFTGPLTLSGDDAFVADGGGTIIATGTGSTITGIGNALTVQGTTIGGAGLTFQSVSSAGNAPSDGIDLANTGSAGSLTVTGTGTPGSGGTIESSGEGGVELSSTYAPSFADMVIENNAADGINGTEVNGLTLVDCTVSGNGTQANVASGNDDGLDFSPNGTGNPDGLTGAVSITNSTITGSADNNAIISDTSGTLNLTVTGSTFSSDNSATGNDGLHVDANGTTNATVSVTGSIFTNNFGNAFEFATATGATGTNSVTFSSNALNSTAGGILGGGVVISPYGNSNTAITVNSNNIQNPTGNGIGIDEDGASGTLTGTVNANVVGTPGTYASGGGIGIGIDAEGSVTETLTISGNDLYQYDDLAGINFFDREGNPAMNLTIAGNLIADPGEYDNWGIYGEVGALNTDNGTVCAAISGNSIAGSGQAIQGGYDIELDQNNSTTIKLPGYTGDTENSNAVQSFLQGNNSSDGTPTARAFPSGSGGGFTGGTSC